MSQAWLAADVEGPTLEGRTTLRIEAGTQSGSVIRLPGAGLPRLGGGGRGDQLVHVFVEVPTRLSARQRELLEEFARESGDNANPRQRSFLDKLRDLFD